MRSDDSWLSWRFAASFDCLDLESGKSTIDATKVVDVAVIVKNSKSTALKYLLNVMVARQPLLLPPTLRFHAKRASMRSH